ncbi:hypothetical protein TUM3794_29630 [Shewanella colwelliana]|uniref:Uncharacterized protein n=1 Tax=Shewanella colwelliana TaxID=23 RepID=A0ABQ4P800_SHECO|nr:hypothetical protein [Shewanella colwelliana]GIU43592.1 hypothetical protein TUM3794_29630 [Shewanella colwelliana]
MKESTDSQNTTPHDQLFVGSDSLSNNKMLASMPKNLRLQIISLLQNPEAPTELIDLIDKTFTSFSDMTETDSEVRSLLPNDVTEKTLAKELAKIPDSKTILEAEQLEAAKLFEDLYNVIVDQIHEPDIDAAQELANAKSLSHAFSEFMPETMLGLFSNLSKESAELFQSALVCQIAGLPKQAKLLFKLFTQRQFIDANEGYQELQTDITKHNGVIETAKNHSKKGQDSRHSRNRQRKEFALSLYENKPFKNPKQAAERLFPAIDKYANEMSHPFSSEFQGFQTVYRWFLAANKTTLQ